jgi:hypothetical protein
MKHCSSILSVLIAALLITALLPAAPSSAGRATYIGIYADVYHNECSYYATPFEVATFWVWVRPGEDGMICVDYEITVPANIIQAATIVNPDAGYHIGDAIVPPGSTVCFPACKTDWIWTHQLTCLVIDANPSVITIDPHDDYGFLRAINCIDFGDSVEEMVKINDLYINQGCCLATESSSWGAIKSMLQ